MSHTVSRRGLGRSAALSAAALALGLPMDTPAAPQQNQAQTPLSSADQAEIDAKFANVVRKYGERLSDDQKTRIRGVLGRHQRMLTRIRAFPIENSDPPATGLRLYPNDTAPRKG